MPTLWFILVAFMLSVYVLLDGFDLGAGVIHLFVAKTNTERRAILQAIGPVWDGNEVWLIAAGGTLFFSFPVLYAASFGGFYLPLIIVLWLLMLRGIAIELRHHIHHPMWTSFWDAVFFLGSALLIIFYGAALGNVVRGVPLNKQGQFFEGLFTNFNPFNPSPGILDWYTILIAAMALAALTAHGANYIAVKTEDPLNARCRRISRQAWLATVVLAAGATAATYFVQPQMHAGYDSRPWGVFFPIIALGGLIGMGYFNSRQQDRAAFLASSAFILGMLASTAFGLYPDVLPAVTPANSLTISNAATTQYGLVVGVAWWSFGMVLAIIYFVLIYRLFRGKVRVTEGGY
jgi:cytochrome d ubiquinol oxidase subunit II